MIPFLKLFCWSNFLSQKVQSSELISHHTVVSFVPLAPLAVLLFLPARLSSKKGGFCCISLCRQGRLFSLHLIA